MSHLVSATSPIAAAHVVKRYPGYGILGADIPAAGSSGGSPTINDGINPAAEYHWRIETPPIAGDLATYPDLSFAFGNAPDGAYSWVYRLYENGVDQGIATVNLSVGAVTSLISAVGTAVASGMANAQASAPDTASAAGGAQSSGAASLISEVMLAAAGFGQTNGFAHAVFEVDVDDWTPEPGLPKYSVIAPNRNYTVRGKNGLLDPKAPTEIITITFDFSALASKLSSAVVACATDAGLPDPVPAAVLVGNPVIIGWNVVQRIQGGQHGTSYQFTCTADAIGGDRFVLIGTLFVRHARVNNQ